MDTLKVTYTDNTMNNSYMATLRVLEGKKGRTIMIDAMYNYRQGDISSPEIMAFDQGNAVTFGNDKRQHTFSPWVHTKLAAAVKHKPDSFIIVGDTEAFRLSVLIQGYPLRSALR